MAKIKKKSIYSSQNMTDDGEQAGGKVTIVAEITKKLFDRILTSVGRCQFDAKNKLKTAKGLETVTVF